MMKDKPNTNTNKHRTTCFGGGGGDVSTFREVGFEICALYRLYGTHYSHYFTVSLLQSRTQVTLPLTLAGSSRLDETRHHVLCSQGSMMGGPPCNGDGTMMAEE